MSVTLYYQYASHIVGQFRPIYVQPGYISFEDRVCEQKKEDRNVFDLDCE